MCGIAGIYLKRNVKHLKLDTIVDTLIMAIDHRGGDATGLASFGDTGLLNFEKATCDGYKFIRGRNYLDPRSKIVMLHTRLATQGEPAFPKNNHPVVNGDIFVTHNGHIGNDMELFSDIGWEYKTADVDSEAIAATINAMGWENYVQALEKFEGSMAIAAVNAQAPWELVLAKGEYSPLCIVENDSIIMWASTHEAIKRAWAAGIGTPPKSFRFLKEGEIYHVSEGTPTSKTFKVKWDEKWWKYAQQTSGNKSCSTGQTVVTVITPQGVTHRVETKGPNGEIVSKPAPPAGGFKNPVSRYDLQAWGWSDLDIEEYVNDLKADHDALRAETDEILQSDPGWWGDTKVLGRFNACWDRIREIKDELEELAWAEMDRLWEREDDEDDDDPKGLDEEQAPTLVQCPSCLEAYPVEEMTGGDMLYCGDCWGFWLESTGEGRSTRSEAKLFDVNGEEIVGY